MNRKEFQVRATFMNTERLSIYRQNFYLTTAEAYMKLIHNFLGTSICAYLESVGKVDF
jgi:hypothetical protein